MDDSVDAKQDNSDSSAIIVATGATIVVGAVATIGVGTLLDFLAYVFTD